FYEPGGLAFGGEGHSQIGGRLYVADTNNHAIRIMKSDGKVETLRLAGLKPTEARPAVGFLLPGAKEINLPPQALPTNSTVELVIDLHLPEGYHLSPLAPFLYGMDSGGSLALEGETTRLEGPGLPVRIPFKTLGEIKELPLKVSIAFYYCREDNQGVCLAESVVWRVPLRLEAQGETVLRLDYAVGRPF
ncbi:MAG TPA: hypothetical protein ACFYED_10075, partial [Candidatus Tripitaka californicus]